jgi:hypothetical protein
MINETCATLWHNGTRYFLPHVSARISSSISKNGIKQKGFFDDSVCTLRVQSETELDISIGDFLRLGNHSGNADRNADFKVMKIYNNLRGVTPHYRLVCER